MSRIQWWVVPVMIGAAAFAGGVVGAGLCSVHPVSAQATSTLAPSTLPPIFQPGSVVTFGAQGPRLEVVQVHGDWVYVAQQPRLSESTVVQGDDERNQFWLHAPSISESWRALDE